jgi:hypothetical protein
MLLLQSTEKLVVVKKIALPHKCRWGKWSWGLYTQVKSTETSIIIRVYEGWIMDLLRNARSAKIGSILMYFYKVPSSTTNNTDFDNAYSYCDTHA